MTDLPVIITCTGCLHYSMKKAECRLGHREEMALCCEDFEFIDKPNRTEGEQAKR